MSKAVQRSASGPETAIPDNARMIDSGKALLPDRSPNATHCVIATSGREARAVQHVGAPEIGAYAGVTAPSAPTECAVSPGAYQGLAALGICSLNSPNSAAWIRSAYISRHLLLIQWNPEIQVRKHPWLANCSQNHAVVNGRFINLIPGVEIRVRHYQNRLSHVLAHNSACAVVQVRNYRALPLHVVVQNRNKDQLHISPRDE